MTYDRKEYIAPHAELQIVDMHPLMDGLSIQYPDGSHKTDLSDEGEEGDLDDAAAKGYIGYVPWEEYLWGRTELEDCMDFFEQ